LETTSTRRVPQRNRIYNTIYLPIATQPYLRTPTQNPYSKKAKTPTNLLQNGRKDRSDAASAPASRHRKRSRSRRGMPIHSNPNHHPQYPNIPLQFTSPILPLSSQFPRPRPDSIPPRNSTNTASTAASRPRARRSRPANRPATPTAWRSTWRRGTPPAGST
jgi:hypothetical protein